MARTTLQETLRRFVILTIQAVLLIAISSCASRNNDAETLLNPFEEMQGPYRPDYGEGVQGYNEPFDESYRRDIGMRAVTWDRWLAISIRNRGADSIYLEPEAFRLVMPDRTLYAIGQERHGMTLFTPTEVPAGDVTLLIARIPELDNLIQLSVILNYPPRDALVRCPIEPVAEAPATATEPRRGAARPNR